MKGKGCVPSHVPPFCSYLLDTSAFESYPRGREIHGGDVLVFVLKLWWMGGRKGYDETLGGEKGGGRKRHGTNGGRECTLQDCIHTHLCLAPVESLPSHPCTYPTLHFVPVAHFGNGDDGGQSDAGALGLPDLVHFEGPKLDHRLNKRVTGGTLGKRRRGGK